jgi:hypothetical protein
MIPKKELMDNFPDFLDPPHRCEWIFLSLPDPWPATKGSLTGHTAAVQKSTAILFSSAYRLLHLYAMWNLEGGKNQPDVERCVRERQVTAEACYLVDQAFPDWVCKYRRECRRVKELDMTAEYSTWLERLVVSVCEMLRIVMGILPSEVLPEIPSSLHSFVQI